VRFAGGAGGGVVPSVPRILELLGAAMAFGLGWVPHFTSLFSRQTEAKKRETFCLHKGAISKAKEA
jgi:hypothetical protein